MKKHYTGAEEPKKLWDAVYRRLKRRKKQNAIGENCGVGFVFYSYEKLINDALAAAVLLSELTEPSDPVTVGMGAYDTATVILACSIISRSVIISDTGESMTFKGLVITDKNTYAPRFISPEELRTLIAGVLSGGGAPNPPSEKGEMELTFRSHGQSVTYSERAVILSAVAFGTGCALTFRDCMMSLLPITCPEGIFCGILAPLLAGATAAVCVDARSTVRYMRFISPTKLFCPCGVAGALLLKLLRIKKRFPHYASNDRALSIDSARLWLNRLSHPRISYLLGGRLRTVIATGEIPAASVKAFFSFGIYSVMMRSVRGLTPALFHYGEDPIGVWKLPVGADADLCNVQKGGVGTVVISSPHIREGNFTPDTYRSNEKRSDSALVTPLSGFILKNGGVFVVEK